MSTFRQSGDYPYRAFTSSIDKTADEMKIDEGELPSFVAFEFPSKLRGHFVDVHKQPAAYAGVIFDVPDGFQSLQNVFYKHGW
jgi:hypothetical protein